ncbi:hypothetical protein BHM03_00061453, partial [Ensete ventricosum]
ATKLAQFGPRWRSDDLAATAAEATSRLINEGWRATPLRHSTRTGSSRSYKATTPDVTSKERSKNNYAKSIKGWTRSKGKFIKSKEKLDGCPKGVSPFVLEIQDKSIPVNF